MNFWYFHHTKCCGQLHPRFPRATQPRRSKHWKHNLKGESCESCEREESKRRVSRVKVLFISLNKTKQSKANLKGSKMEIMKKKHPEVIAQSFPIIVRTLMALFLERRNMSPADSQRGQGGRKLQNLRVLLQRRPSQEGSLQGNSGKELQKSPKVCPIAWFILLLIFNLEEKR